MSKQPKFHIYEDHSGEWQWRLKAANGRIIAMIDRGDFDSA